jgi:hypothetical protein
MTEATFIEKARSMGLDPERVDVWEVMRPVAPTPSEMASHTMATKAKERNET